MAMSCESNDADFRLANEYKYLLSNIRPLIEQLNNTRDVQLCLLWLSKLEQSGKWERTYRNKILSELCKQVNEKCLKQPFSEPPPSGPLRNLVMGNIRMYEWNLNELSEISTELSSNSPRSELTVTTSKRHSSPVTWSPVPLTRKGLVKSIREEADHSECFLIQKAYHKRAQSDQLVIEKYQNIIKSLFAQQHNKADVSSNTLKKLQSNYESKITELVHSLQKAQDENNMLKRNISSIRRDLHKAELLKNETENLREQIAILTNAKNSLDIKYKECEEQKLMTFTDLMSQLNESDRKFRESEKRFKSLERRYEENCHNFETEYQAKKIELEKNYTANLSAMERLLEQKDAEIVDLKQQITSQCFHFEEEITKLKQEFVENATSDKDKKKVMAEILSNKKAYQIKVLKSKARKLEKMREHMAVLFHSQLQQIISKKDFYIATLEMQLKMLTSECVNAKLGSDDHNTLIKKVSTLEAQYRKLLEDSEKQSTLRRQLDLQKIHSLEKQLLLCGGVVEDEESTFNCLKTKSLISVTAVNEGVEPDSLP